MDKISIKTLVERLTEEEKIELIHLLNEGITTDKIVGISKVVSRDRKTVCPHCQSVDIYGHGKYRGRNRYKCRSCHKTFNENTGTAISGIKKLSEFQSYIKLLLDSVSIRKAAKKLHVNVFTIFTWRHKLLSALTSVNESDFIGIVESDDKQMNINEKGNKQLSREGFKRPSDRQTKRGISNDKISVIVATDRQKNSVMKVAKRGRIDVKSIEKAIGNQVQTDNVFCSDSHPSIIAWAASKQLEHHCFVASKQHVKDKCYHIQHVNSLDNRFERWQKQFYGVSTKYLQNYLNWFIFLEKVKSFYDRFSELAKIIFENTLTIKLFRNIQGEYEKLICTQFAKT
jgi:transposase-like protein